MLSVRSVLTFVAGTLICCLLAGMPARAQISFSVFTDPHPTVGGGTISITYAGDMFVGSVQGDGTGQLYKTDLTGGNVQLFAPSISLAANPSGEHFLASSLGLGGFPIRDIYAASGNSILHINHAGTSSDTLVSGLNGSVRGILFDAIGTFGHDMLVTTNAGGVYRVNSSGMATLLASTGEDTEGLDVVPLGAGFGGHDGELVVASEGSGLLRAINTAGAISVLNAGNPIAGAEELTFVPLNLGESGDPVEGFYGANYTPNVIKAGADQFHNSMVDYRGDAIVTGETTGNVSRLHFNGVGFDITTVGHFPNQPEDGIFVTQAIIQGVPEPGTVTLFLSMAAGSLFAYRRLRRRH